MGRVNGYIDPAHTATSPFNGCLKPPDGRRLTVVIEDLHLDDSERPAATQNAGRHAPVNQNVGRHLELLRELVVEGGWAVGDAVAQQPLSSEGKYGVREDEVPFQPVQGWEACRVS